MFGDLTDALFSHSQAHGRVPIQFMFIISY